MKKSVLLILFSLLLLPTFADICQTSATWVDVQVEPCAAKTFMGVGIIQDLTIDLKDGFKWKDFDMYLSINEEAFVNAFQKYDSIEVNVPSYDEFETCENCTEIQYNDGVVSCVFRPDYEVVEEQYKLKYASYFSRGLEPSVSFNDFYKSKVNIVEGTDKICNNNRVISDVSVVNVSNVFVPLTLNKVENMSRENIFYSVEIISESETVNLKVAIDSPGNKAGAWKFILVKAGMDLTYALDNNLIWFVDPFWWSEDWDYRSTINVAYPKGLMASYTTYGDSGYRYEIPTDEYIGMRTSRIILDTGNWYDDGKIKQDCADVRFIAEELPYDVNSWVFPLEAEDGIDAYDSLYLYSNTLYFETSDGWTSPFVTDITKVGNPEWVQTNTYDWEKYSMSFPDDADADYLQVENTESFVFPSLPQSWITQPQDRAYVIVSATLDDSSLRDGYYMILDKINWVTQTGWGIGVKHTLIGSNHRYCLMVLNGVGGIGEYEGKCVTTASSSERDFNFVVAYDSDSSELWIIDDDLSIYMSSTLNLDMTVNEQYFSGVSLVNSNDDLLISSDSPVRDWVGNINYLEFITPSDEKYRWQYVLSRLQLLENGFIELPYYIEGGIDSGVWEYDEQCHTSTTASKTAFLVTVPPMVRLPIDGIDHRQLEFSSEAIMTSCSNTGCANLADGSYSTFWTASSGAYTEWDMLADSSSQGFVLIIDDTSSTSANITVDFYNDASLVNSFSNIVSQAGQIIFEDLRTQMISQFDEVKISVSSGVVIQEFELFTSSITDIDELSFENKIVIDYVVTESRSDYPLMFEVNTQSLISSGDMNSNCSDVLLTDSNGLILPISIKECNTTETLITTELTQISEGNYFINMYYGSNTSFSRPADNWIYDFVDDFEDNIIDPMWRVCQGSYSCVGYSGGGTVTEVGGALNLRLGVNNGFALCTLYAEAALVNHFNQPGYTMEFFINPSDMAYGLSFVEIDEVQLCNNYETGIAVTEANVNTNDGSGLQTTFYGLTSNVTVKVEWGHNSVKYYKNGLLFATHTNPPDNGYLTLKMQWERRSSGDPIYHETFLYDFNIYKSGSTSSISVGIPTSGNFSVNIGGNISTYKVLLVPQSPTTPSAQVVSVGNLFYYDEGLLPVYFSDKIRLDVTDVSGGLSVFQLVLQQPFRTGGIYFVEDATYGNKRVQFIYEDDSFYTSNQEKITTYSSLYGTGSTAYYNPNPTKKVKDIYIYIEDNEGTNEDEIWSRIRFFSAPVSETDFLSYFPKIGIYYGNSEATAPNYNPNTNSLLRAFIPNYVFEFSDDEKDSEIYASFSGGFISAVTGGTLLTDLLSANLRTDANNWNNKTFDATHEWVGEYWRGITSSGLSVFAKLLAVASTDIELGNHDSTFGYPLHDGTKTFFDTTIANPLTILASGGNVFGGAEIGCYKCYGNFRLFSENTSGTGSQLNTGSSLLVTASSLYSLRFIELAVKKSTSATRETFDSLKWIFTEPFHEWTVGTLTSTFYADISIDSTTVLPSQVESGVPFVVRAIVSSEGSPLSGATCSALYSGDAFSMTETSAGQYSAEITSVYEIETVYVSCSYGASSDSSSATFDVVLSGSEFISITATTDLEANMIYSGEDFVPLASVTSNDYENLVCEWYFESSPSTTYSMITFAGVSFNYAPTPGNIYKYTDDVIVECCRGDFCNSAQMSVKLIDEISTKDVQPIYFNNELPLGGDFAVISDIRALGNLVTGSGISSFSDVILPEDAYTQVVGATGFPNTANSFGALVEFEGNNYSMSWNGNEYQSVNITAPVVQGAYNFKVYAYYELEDSSRIFGTGLGVIYAGSEVPLIDVEISPISPNSDITVTTIDILTKDKDDLTPVEMNCDILITALLNDTTVPYAVNRTSVGVYSLFLSDIFLGNVEIRTECEPDTLNYTNVFDQQDYIFGSSSMTVNADVNPDFALSGSVVTVTATASYGSFASCVPDCSVYVSGQPFGQMNCSNVDRVHSLEITAPSISGAYNVEVECIYGTDIKSDIDSFLVGVGGYISIYFDPTTNDNADFFTILANVADVDGTPLSSLICSATVEEQMSGVSQSYSMSESVVTDGLYSVYVDDGWIGDLEVRVSCVDGSNTISVVPKETIYNIGGLAPYNIGIFTAPQLPSQCSDNLQLQLFLSYRESVNETYVYPECPNMLCDVSVKDENGLEVATAYSIPSIGSIRTTFMDLSNVCGSLTVNVVCADSSLTCTGGTRRAYINLAENKPSNDYCGNGICGRNEFGECDWDCSVFEEFTPFVSTSQFSNEYRISLYNSSLTCRMDRDWVNVKRELPLAYSCGSLQRSWFNVPISSDEACSSRTISNALILMRDTDDFYDIPETLQTDFNLPEYYSVTFGTTTLSLPAEAILRNPAFVSDVQGIYGTFKYPLLLSLQSGVDKIIIDKYEPSDIYGYIDMFYDNAYVCEPSSLSNCFDAEISLNKSNVLVTQFQTLTCWNDDGQFYVESFEDTFEYDPSSGSSSSSKWWTNLTVLAYIIVGAPLLFGLWSLMIKTQKLNFERARIRGGR